MTAPLGTIKRVVKYQASDGDEFETPGAARLHNLEIETQQLLKPIVGRSAFSGDDAVTHVLVLNAAKIRDILNNYLRRLPKPEQVQQTKPQTAQTKRAA